MAEDLKQTTLKEILNYKPVKSLITTILGLLVIGLIYSLCNHVYRCHNDLKSTLLWGLDQCEECKTISNKSDTLAKTTIIHDTIKIPQYIKSQTITPSSKEVSIKSIPNLSQKTDSGNNQANVNNGVNNGSIGNNNNNFFGKVRQHPNDRLIHQLDSALPNKDEPIEIMAISSGAGSADFATELKEAMKKFGYKKITVGVGQRAPIPKKGVTLDTMFKKKSLIINVD